MGYYSHMSASTFFSSLPPEKMKEAWEDFKACLKNDNVFYLGIYGLATLTSDGGNAGEWEYEIIMEDTYAKHYEDELLAKFISSVIANGKHMIIEFEGEDASKWGWLILSEELHEIEYIRYVGGAPLSDFIKQRTNVEATCS